MHRYTHIFAVPISLADEKVNAVKAESLALVNCDRKIHTVLMVFRIVENSQ